MDTPERVNATASPYVGFDIISIVTLLLPILAACFKQQQGGTQDPRPYLREQFNPEADRFPRSLIARTLPQVRRAARQNGKQLSHRQQMQIAEDSLKQSMLASDEEIQKYMSGLSAEPIPVVEDDREE